MGRTRPIKDSVEAEITSTTGSTVSATQRMNSFFSRYWDFALIVVLAIVLWLPRLSGPIDLRYDAGVYYLLGTSLATGHGYRIPSEPGAPEALQYPPLLPAIVALYQKALGSTDPEIVAPWLRKSYAVLFLGYGLAVLTLARRFLPRGLAAAAAALCLLHHQTIFLSDLLFAELPFALLTLGFALVAGSVSRPVPTWPREAISYLLALAGFLLRTAGLALFVAWVLEAVVNRRWRLAIIRSGLALIPFVAWQGYTMHVRASDEYANPAYAYQRAPYQYYNVSYAENALLIDPFRPELGRVNVATMASRLVRNLPELVEALGQSVSTTKVEWRHLFGKVQRISLGHSAIPLDVVLVPIFLFAAFILYGLILMIRARAWLMVLLICSSVGLVWTTPWPAQFPRYLAPLIPLFDICFLLAWRQTRSALPAKSLGQAGTVARLALTGVLVLAFAMELYTASRFFRARQLPGGLVLDPAKPDQYRLFAHNPTWRAWEKALKWIDANAPKDAIIATSAPHFCYLLTGHRAVLPPMESDKNRARRLLEAVPVSYVVVDTLEFLDVSRRYALPAVESDPAEWRLLHSVAGARVYGRTTGQQ